MHTGKCPSCNKVLSHAKIDTIDLKQGFQAVYNGVSYQCPSCHVVLAVGFDPIALKTDTVNAVLQGLGKKVP